MPASTASIPLPATSAGRAAVLERSPRHARASARWVRAAIVSAAGWTAYSLFTTTVTWMLARDAGETALTWPRILRWQIVAPAVWAPLTPVIVAIARRWTFARDRWRVPLAVHAVTALAVAVVVAAVEWLAWPIVRGGSPRFAPMVVQAITFRLALYAVIVSAAQGVLHRRRLEEGRAEELRLRAELADERVRVLSLQLEPHFLYNTLHAVSELVHVDADRADRAIMRLADLLRSTTLQGTRPQIALKEELALATAYAELLHLRWGDGLTISIDVPPDLLDAAVPPLLVQPLIENAVRHGIGRRPEGTIRVRAVRDASDLWITVDDDGTGPPESRRTGLGLGNLTRRLEHLHGTRGAVTMGRSTLGGTRVEVRLPAIRVVAPRPEPAS